MFSSTSCSPEFETLIVRCRPFYSPHELSSVILVGVYIPPKANARTAINNLAASITAIENADPDSIVLALSDFNHINVRKALPKYKQHVKCSTRDDKILELITVTVPFQMPFMQFHELLLIVLTMSWSASFPHTCKSSSLTNLSQRLSRNGPMKPFYLFRDVLTVLTGPCSASPVPTKMSMQTQLPLMAVFVQTPASPQRLSHDKPWFSKDIKHKLIAKNDAFENSDKNQYNMKLRRL